MQLSPRMLVVVTTMVHYGWHILAGGTGVYATQATADWGRPASTGSDDTERKVLICAVVAYRDEMNYHGWLKWYLDVFGGIPWYSYIITHITHRCSSYVLYCLEMESKWIQSVLDDSLPWILRMACLVAMMYPSIWEILIKSHILPNSFRYFSVISHRPHQKKKRAHSNQRSLQTP